MAVATTQQANYIVKGKFKDGITGPAGKAFASFKRAAKAAFKAAAVGAVALGLLIKKTLDSFDSIGKGADRIGITTDALQEYRFAFDKAGVSQEAVDKSLLNFTKRLGKARQGIGALAGGLKGGQEQLLATLKGTSNATEALEVMFQALGNAKDATERAALADAAFGGGGLKMTAAFKDGSAAFQEWINVSRNGRIVSEEMIRKAERLNDAMSDLGAVVKVAFGEGLIDGFVDDFGGLEKIINDKTFQDNLRNLGEGLGGLFGPLVQGNFIPMVTGFFIQIANVMAGLLSLVNLLQSGWFALGAAIGSVTDALSLSEGQFDKFSKKASDSFAAYEASIKPLSDSFRELLGIEVEGKTNSIAKAMENAGASINQANDGTISLTKSSTELARVTDNVTVAVRKEGDEYSKLADKMDRLTGTNTGFSAGNSAKADATILFSQRVEESKRIVESMRTPLEVYRAEVSNLNVLHKAGALDIIPFTRAIRAARDAYRSASDAARLFGGSIDSGGGIPSTLGGGVAGRFLGDIPRRSISELLNSGGQLLGGRVPSFASGIDRVPFDMFARIHKGEKILNKKDAEQSRQGGGRVSIGNVTFQISGEKKNPRQLAREIRSELQRIDERVS